MDRPIVLNSLLCFIHNYRDSLLPNQLNAFISKYFAKSAITGACSLLLDLLPPNLSATLSNDIIVLYDRVQKTEQPPVFAAADLSALPLTLITDEGDSKNELLREIRQLKRFIQDALNGKVEEPAVQSNSRTPPTDDQLLSTPKPMCKMNISASSPESPSSTGLFNTSSSSTGAPSTNSQPSPPNLQSSPVTICINSSANNTNNLSVTNNHHKRKHETSGNRLDAMVRKLADKQKEKEAREASPPSSVWTPQLIDHLNFLNMMRSVANVSSQSGIFPPSVAQAVLNDTSGCQKSESTAASVESAVVGMEELTGECGVGGVQAQVSDDSSPSPSDSSNNIDDFNAFNVNDLAEKPFTCEHANCHKRFANKFLLKKHQFIHTGLRPHCCPFCGKRFNRKDNLLRHKKTHSSPVVGTDVAAALSSEFLLQFNAEKPVIKLENEEDEEGEL